jgi:hypothetical protein
VREPAFISAAVRRNGKPDAMTEKNRLAVQKCARPHLFLQQSEETEDQMKCEEQTGSKKVRELACISAAV